MRLHVIVLVVSSLLALGTCDIVTFDNTDPLTRHFHTQSDTLYSRESQSTTRPYISFQGMPACCVHLMLAQSNARLDVREYRGLSCPQTSVESRSTNLRWNNMSRG